MKWKGRDEEAKKRKVSRAGGGHERRWSLAGTENREKITEEN